MINYPEDREYLTDSVCTLQAYINANDKAIILVGYTGLLENEKSGDDNEYSNYHVIELDEADIVWLIQRLKTLHTRLRVPKGSAKPDEDEDEGEDEDVGDED